MVYVISRRVAHIRGKFLCDTTLPMGSVCFLQDSSLPLRHKVYPDWLRNVIPYTTWVSY